MQNGISNTIAKSLEPLKSQIMGTKSISGIDSEYFEIVAEIVGKLLRKRVRLISSDGESGRDGVFDIKVGDHFDINDFLKLGYERVERVWNEGEISLMGDVVVIWPFSMNNLLRISLNVEDIEFIDIVDVLTRKKIKGLEHRIILPEGSQIYIGNEDSEEDISFNLVHHIGEESESINLGVRRIPGIENFSNTKILSEIIGNFKSRGFKVIYLTNSPSEYKKIADDRILSRCDEVFESHDIFEKKIERGFVILSAKLLVITDLEVLGGINLSKYQEANKSIDPSSVEILKKILPNDYIVHQDHGIGKFLGVQQRENGYYIEIGYAGEDRLFVPLTAASKVTKYIGAGKRRPILTGLNSGVWKRVSLRAKTQVEEIAKELLQLYALRESSISPFVLESDLTGSIQAFVDQFEFTDTDDQILATSHIIKDFESGKPMDRLLVGDVGFGKTEIAMRAIFAAVESGFQVAALAPTTILVEQHLNTFKERFKKYPFTISSISRFSDASEREETISGLKKGTIDIVVGTHALLSDDIGFKNLGLLVIDEEQKFGVKQKEKIKQLRVNTNVLSLTATPIPRTLNMALSGIRDITVLAIPPVGRIEIQNIFEKFNWDSVYKAISKELDRNGQVYFLHNRVGNIQGTYERLEELFPKARIAIAHGQMNSDVLSKTMMDFVDGNIDILLCTTIIENGLDIPNANTLIVDDATRLGLSQMYQIRGRIGRSTTQAYAYFFYDSLSGDSEERLSALKDSQPLGSGFVLSNRDLEIRGSGDILGKNQSGAINSVGYGLYTQMLQDAVRELRRTRR